MNILDIAARILSAMQKPIDWNEKYLDLNLDIPEVRGDLSHEMSGFHPDQLRLPDAHQKKECIVCDGVVGKDAQLCDEHGRIWLGRKPAPEPSLGAFKQLEKCACGEYFGVTHPRAQNCTKTTPEPEKCRPYHSACYSCHSCIPCGKCKCELSLAAKGLP